MNIEINIDRQPVAARGVVARQISYKEMWEKVSARVDVLTGELEAANQHVKILQQRNEQLWDSYQDLRCMMNARNQQEARTSDKNALNEQSSTRIHTEAVANSVPVQNWTGINEPAPDSAIDYKLTILNLESQLAIAKKLLSHRDKGYLEKYKEIEEYQKMLDSMTTDSRIAELLATIDQVAIDYGSLGFGLPIHVPSIKERMFEAVRNWVSGK